MGRAARLRPRCTSINTDGTQCGKRCHDGQSPAQCHIHRAQANGGHIGTPFVATKTPMERIEQMAAKDGHPNQMQALKILLEDAKAPVEGADYAGIVHRLTLAQRQHLRDLLTEIRELKETARTQAMTWDPAHQAFLDAEPLADVYVATTPVAKTTNSSPASGYATEDEALVANPNCVVIEEIDGRFFVENPDPEDLIDETDEE